MEWFQLFIIGMIIGLANIIPGVSGGTMAVICGVFDRLIGAVSNIRKEFKKSILFLIPIGLGAVLAIVLLSKALTWLLDNYYMATNFFFIGVIVGSIPMLLKKSVTGGFCAWNLIPFAVTFAIMLVMAFLTPEGTSTVIRELDVFVFIKLMLYAALAAICMIIPGLSGSFVMLLLGVYETITTAIAKMNILLLIPVGIGILGGILGGSKLIDWLLKRFPWATYWAIFGFVIGSIPSIFQKIGGADAYRGGWELIIGILVLLIGITISFVFASDKLKEKLTASKKAAEPPKE